MAANAVRVVTDSACDLPEDVARELGIEIVPLTIRFGDEEFVDRRDLTTDEFWSRSSASPVLPETAAPSAGAFEDVFRRLADEGATGIVCVNLSSKLSATIQSAQIGAKAVEGRCPVEVLDSLAVSLAIGNQAVVAARLARDGADLATITRQVLELRERTRTYAALDTLDNLRKGGRVGNAQAMLGSMLSVKPVISVDDGEVHAAARVRTRSKALRWLVDKVKEEGTVEDLAILHGNAPDIDSVVEMLEPLYPSDEIMVSQVGPVIGAHAGLRVVGITYHRPR